jgi:hypothetical protein
MPLQNEVGKFEGIGTAIYEEFNTAMLLNRNARPVTAAA